MSRTIIALRSAATVLLALIVGQAGWAAAFLGQDRSFFTVHVLFAKVTLVAAVATAVLYFALRRAAGPVLVGLALAVAALVVGQYAIGELGLTAPHIFLGVLTAMAGTALASWTYRHQETP